MPLQLGPVPNLNTNIPSMPNPLDQAAKIAGLRSLLSASNLQQSLAPFEVQEAQAKAQQAGIATQQQQQELDSRKAMMALIANGDLNKYAGVETPDGSGFDAAGAYQALISKGVLPAQAGEYVNSWLTIGKSQAEITKNLGEGGKALQEIREKTLKQVANKLGDIGDMPVGKAATALDAFRQDLVTNPKAYRGLTQQEMSELYGADLTHLDALEGHLGMAEMLADFHKSKAEAANVAGKGDPNSPLYDPSAAYLAKRAAAGDPEAQSILAQQTKQAGAKAGAEAAAKFPWEARLEQMRQQGDPVFAYDPKNKQTVQVSRSEAQQSGFTNIVKVGQSEIDKAKTSAMQLGDATMNIQAYKQASQRMDELSGSDIATVSRVLGDSQFKAHFLGAELPTDWANELYKSKGWQDMPESAKDAVVNYLAARPAAISLLRAINPGVRLTESQIATELKNIPDPTVPSDIRDRQFARLDRNIDQASKTLVKIPGVDLPSEIRDRLASQAGAEQATRANIAAREAAKIGQYKNAKGNKMNVGDDAYDSTTKRYLGTVSKVYADNSYDVKPD